MPASFANPAITNRTISTTTNRITSSGWTYDSAGNTLTDANGQSYTYDGENKQVEVIGSGLISLDGIFTLEYKTESEEVKNEEIG